MELGWLTEWNPWWENPDTVNELEGIPRPKYSQLIDSIQVREITVLSGIRRSGKSTLMYQIIGNLLRAGTKPHQILFVNLEDKKLADVSLDDIYEVYRRSLNIDDVAYIFFDEVQKKEGWESWIRKKYDLKTKDKFVISGSSSYLLRKEYSTLLTGRNLTFEVFPLSFKEFLLFKNVDIDIHKIKTGVILETTKRILIKLLDEYLKLGGFPEVLFKPEQFKIKLLEQYFDDILYKDIVDRHNLNNQKAKDLALFFMSNFTCLFSLRNIRNSLQLSYDASKDYLSYYKEAFLFFTIDHFSYSFKEQKTMPSKIYCIDNGLRNAVSFKFSKDDGKLAENLVFVELTRKGKNVYYWKNKHEVDFIVKEGSFLQVAINVSYSDEIDEREIKGLHEFKKNFGINKLVLITKDIEAEERGVRLIPLWKWLLLE
ncbi:ATP-binding protein [Candidatus Woesearchaeota archaeon]|nr:ATP-binding protein [Candidatus Woesearchaeota archaeon]